MIEYKENVAARLPVRLLDTSGNPVTGVVFGSVTASLEYSDGTTATVTVGSPQWTEVTTGAFSGQGVYNLIVPLGQINIAGVMFYCVSVSGARAFTNYVNIVANIESDTVVLLNKYAGMLNYNSVIDMTTFNSNTPPQLLTARIRVYDSAADALAAGLTGLLYTYSVAATYSGSNLSTYSITGP